MSTFLSKISTESLQWVRIPENAGLMKFKAIEMQFTIKYMYTIIK